jgi:hypothetical protein
LMDASQKQEQQSDEHAPSLVQLRSNLILTIRALRPAPRFIDRRRLTDIHIGAGMRYRRRDAAQFFVSDAEQIVQRLLPIKLLPAIQGCTSLAGPSDLAGPIGLSRPVGSAYPRSVRGNQVNTRILAKKLDDCSTNPAAAGNADGKQRAIHSQILQLPARAAAGAQCVAGTTRGSAIPRNIRCAHAVPRRGSACARRHPVSR